MRSKRPQQKKRKRVGRGSGSGHGKTSCRGMKGQGSRSGAKSKPGFEGGQNPIYRRLPKRGFNNAAFREEYAIVNVARLGTLQQQEITPETLLQEGVVSQLRSGIKVLGDGELTRAVTVKAHQFSRSAKEKIEKAGGKAILIKSQANA